VVAENDEIFFVAARDDLAKMLAELRRQGRRCASS